MNALWKQWAARLDDLSLRERGFFFVVAAGLVVLVAHAALLQPLLREQRAYFDRITLGQNQLKAVNEELLKGAQGSAQSPQTAKLERMRSLEAGLAEAEKRLARRREAEQLGPEQLTRLLRDVLAPGRGLRVIALRVMPPAALSRPAPVGARQSSTPTPPSGQFYRHVIELEMTGTYLEFLKYLDDVEALPWRLAWSSVELKTLVYPQVQMRATLYTVSPSPGLFTF
jgi:MSHA biogenesis protein MshJ